MTVGEGRKGRVLRMVAAGDVLIEAEKELNPVPTTAAAVRGIFMGDIVAATPSAFKPAEPD